MLKRASRILSTVLCVVLLAASGASPIFLLVQPVGLDFTLQNSPTPHKHLIETMPGGVALLDYNNDGLLDIFLVNGGDCQPDATSRELRPPQPQILEPAVSPEPKDGSFTDVTAADFPSLSQLPVIWIGIQRKSAPLRRQGLRREANTPRIAALGPVFPR
jgi:hypothetical protein